MIETPGEITEKWAVRGIRLSLYEYKSEQRLRVNDLVVPKGQRRDGIGTQIMEEILTYADGKGLRVELTPSTDYGATSERRLKKFYKRFCFVENKGRSIDHAISESMYRPVRKPSNLAA